MEEKQKNCILVIFRLEKSYFPFSEINHSVVKDLQDGDVIKPIHMANGNVELKTANSQSTNTYELCKDFSHDTLLERTLL